ncbi:LysE family transporter [Streptomyces sp. NPDC046876]|uniref:LysE family transporter n=1 Tax=Streptomyces sp. NPDC046876 TaxID=3155616 RepID=UPI00340ED19E
MTELLTPALAGTVAGLGVAMPMGAMSVLLLQEAMRDRRTAVAAGAGVAVVDLGYAALATAVGPWIASRVSPVEAWIRLIAAAALLAIAARGLYGATRATAPAPPAGPPGDPSPGADAGAGSQARTGSDARSASDAGTGSGVRDAAGPGAGAGSGAETGSGAGPGAAAAVLPAAVAGIRPGRTRRAGGAGRAFGRYVGLTAVNPTTALYFAALTTAQAAALDTAAAAGAFVTGVAVASLLWQQALVALGALAGRRIPPEVRTWTFRLGYGLVAVYAVKIALPLP